MALNQETHWTVCFCFAFSLWGVGTSSTERGMLACIYGDTKCWSVRVIRHWYTKQNILLLEGTGQDRSFDCIELMA